MDIWMELQIKTAVICKLWCLKTMWNWLQFTNLREHSCFSTDQDQAGSRWCITAFFFFNTRWCKWQCWKNFLPQVYFFFLHLSFNILVWTFSNLRQNRENNIMNPLCVHLASKAINSSPILFHLYLDASLFPTGIFEINAKHPVILSANISLTNRIIKVH